MVHFLRQHLLPYLHARWENLQKFPQALHLTLFVLWIQWGWFHDVCHGEMYLQLDHELTWIVYQFVEDNDQSVLDEPEF